MSTNKKSFLLHIDSLDILDDLTNGQAGVLFKAIKAYQHNDDFELDSIVKIAFSPFKNQFARDDEKYIKTCEKRVLAGQKGGSVYSKDPGIDNHGEMQLYVIKLYSDDEEFIKIGTTSNKLNRRFSGPKNMPYNYEILHQVMSDDLCVIDLEAELQGFIEEYSYTPNKKFPGYTECFTMKSLKKLVSNQSFAQAKGSKANQTEANVADSNNKNKNKTKNKSDSKSKDIVTSESRFSPPSDIETVAYFESKGSTASEAEKFWLFYDSKNWMVGKSKMKKWKSSAGLWIGRNKTENKSVDILKLSAESNWEEGINEIF